MNAEMILGTNAANFSNWVLQHIEAVVFSGKGWRQWETNLVFIILVMQASFLDVATNWKAQRAHLPALWNVLQVVALDQSAWSCTS